MQSADYFTIPSPPADIEWRRRHPALYSWASLLLPLLILLVGVQTTRELFDDVYVQGVTRCVFSVPEQAGRADEGCRSVTSPDARTLNWARATPAVAAISEYSGRLRFSASQTFLLFSAVVSLAVSAAIIAGELQRHGGVERPLVRVLLCLLAASLAACYVLSSWVGPITKVKDFFVYVVPEVLRVSNVAEAGAVIAAVETHGARGILAIVVAAAAIMAGAATLGYRWRAGAWCTPAILRAQMNALLVMFAVASVVLVVSNAAIRSLLDWPAGLIPAAGDKNVDLLSSVHAAATSLSYLWSVLSTAILLATFVPAFVSLFADIDLAALKQSRTARPIRGCPMPEPSMADTRAWKERHGLSFSVSQVVTAVVSAAAPLLAAPAIDLAKLIPGLT